MKVQIWNWKCKFEKRKSCNIVKIKTKLKSKYVQVACLQKIFKKRTFCVRFIDRETFKFYDNSIYPWKAKEK